MRTGRSNNKVWLLVKNKYNKQALIDYEKLIDEFSFDKLGLDFNKDIIIHEKYKNLVEPYDEIIENTEPHDDIVDLFMEVLKDECGD